MCSACDLVDVAKEWQAAGKLKNRTAWAEECAGRKRSVEYLRKTNYENMRMKPQRVYQQA
jgi:tartronate-semialdehyde synthase